MAVADITPFSDLAQDSKGNVIPSGVYPGVGNNIQVEIGVASAPSAPMPETTRLVRVHTEAACRFAVGTNPVATSASPRMAAGQTEYMGLRAGDKIAFIAD